MPTTIRVVDRGRRDADVAYREAARELRDRRLAANISQRTIATTVGMDQSRISRIEAATGRPPRLDDLAVHAAALGLRLSVRLYPTGSPVRDAAQLRLIERLRALVSGRFKWTVEAPIGGYRDERAWDVRLDAATGIGIDAETRLRDIQLIQRRTETKLRDSDVEVVVLLVADTKHNRRVVRDHSTALASTFPISGRRAIADLRAGRIPRGNAIVVL